MQSTESYQLKSPTMRGKVNGVGRILLCCYYEPIGINTICENIYYLQILSDYSLDVLNFYGQQSPFRIPNDFDLASYDAIVFHNTVTYNISCLSEIDRNVKISLNQFEGVKVFFKQDEHYRTSEASQFIHKNNIDLVFTCVENRHIDKFYPKEIVKNNVEFVHMLTGYVLPWMRSGLGWRSVEEQLVDVGYRGSIQPLHFGRLAYEKRQIGDVVKDFYDGTSVSIDITSQWENRLSGKKWIEFLRNSKTTLGVESGASIIDFDGEIEKKYDSIVTRIGKHYDNPAWCEEVLKELITYEDNAYYKALSPRHFEASACGSVQVLYEGDYMGILIPNIHYVPLKRNLDNIEYVSELICDTKKLSQIREACFEEVIKHPSYWIESFVLQFDQALDRAISKKGLKQRAKRYSQNIENVNVILLCAHKPSKDPRISWIADNAPQNMKIHVLGVEDDPNLQKDVCEKSSFQYQITSYRYRFSNSWISGLVSNNELSNVVAYLEVLKLLADYPNDKLSELLEAENDDVRIFHFRLILLYFLGTTSTLFELGRLFKNVDSIIAVDLECLPAGILLKEHFNGVPLVYDAHEYWPESSTDFSGWETKFWSNIEKSLVKYSDLRVTVSPQIANLMTKVYGYNFDFLPNCEPISSMAGVIARYSSQDEEKGESRSNEVCFVYQGGFAKGRGLELLINAWQKTNQRAILILRGPENDIYSETLKNIALKTGLLGSRIIFAPSVREYELIEYASRADVGVIPYEPIGQNNRYCCPNKLSQYCVAGLPILSNETEFLKEVLEGNDLGKVVNFANEELLIGAIDYFVSNLEFRVQCGQRSREFFEEQFNWDLKSRSFYENLGNAIQKNPSALSHQSFSKEPDKYHRNFLAQSHKSVLVIPIDFPYCSENYTKSDNTRLTVFSIARRIAIKLGIFSFAQGIWQKLPLSLRIPLR